MNKITKQIIVIPGIMGSKLKQGLLRIWPSYVGKINCRTHLGEKLKYKENDKTIATGPFKVFYQKLIDSLEQIDSVVDVFSYDWRKNNLDQLSLLENVIRTDVDEIYIVAHSMGGIIAKLFLNYYKNSDKVKKVKKLITLGTPWNGLPDAYKMMLYGAGNPLLLSMYQDNSKDIIATFPSVYQLLPDEVYINNCLNESKPMFLEEDGNELTWNDIYNYKYIPLIDAQGLKEDEVFNTYYSLKNQNIAVEHHEIIGYGYATLYSIIKNSPNETMCEFNNGDSTVPICSANSNAPYQYFVKEKHQNLVKNKKVLEIINSIINNKIVCNDEIENSYEKASKYKFTGKIFKVACPAIVSLIDENGNTIYGNMDFDENADVTLLDENKYNIVEIDNILYLIIEDNEEKCISENNKINKLFIEAYDEASVTISIEEFQKGQVKKVAAFNSFNINSDISVELKVDNDINNCNILINKLGSKPKVEKAIIESTKIRVHPITI